MFMMIFFGIPGMRYIKNFTEIYRTKARGNLKNVGSIHDEQNIQNLDFLLLKLFCEGKNIDLFSNKLIFKIGNPTGNEEQNLSLF